MVGIFYNSPAGNKTKRLSSVKIAQNQFISSDLFLMTVFLQLFQTASMASETLTLFGSVTK